MQKDSVVKATTGKYFTRGSTVEIGRRYKVKT